MSYPRLYDRLPIQRFATNFSGRAAAANYHGATIARLLAAKTGLRVNEVLPLMAPPLAREAARALGAPIDAPTPRMAGDLGGCDDR